MNSQKLLPRLRATSPGQLFDWCFNALDHHGLHQAFQRGKLSDHINPKLEFVNEDERDNRFIESALIELSPLEALSLAYLCLYYDYIIAGEHEYFIGFEMEDAYKSESEQFLSDGLLMQYRGDKQEAIMPFQETKAIGLLRADPRSIENKVIENLNKKIARRSNYPDLCGLMISILPSHSNIDYKRIVDACDISVYDEVLALEYVGNNLRTCAVHALLDLKANPQTKLVVPVISPRFFR